MLKLSKLLKRAIKGISVNDKKHDVSNMAKSKKRIRKHCEAVLTRFLKVSNMVKSKKRIRDVGEVFTPDVVVEAMLDLFPDDAWGADKNWLEPTCGNGQFVVAILNRKLGKTDKSKNGFVTPRFPIFDDILNTTFGMDIMPDNILECKHRIYREVFPKSFKCGRLDNRKEGKRPIKSLIGAICIVENNFVVTADTLEEDLNSKFVKFEDLPDDVQRDRRAEIEAAFIVDEHGTITIDPNSRLYKELAVFAS